MLVRMDFVPTYARKATAADEGATWLYVTPKTHAQHRVEIDTVPDNAQRIRVQHLDRDMGGKAEWVPIARAKVPWVERGDYFATLEMWAAAEKHRPLTAHSDLAMMLIGTYLKEGVAEVCGNGVGGILEIRDLGALSRETSLPINELTAHEDTFEDGSTFAPWPTTLLVLQSLCALRPQPALEVLGRLRADARAFARNVAEEGDPWWVQEAREGQTFARRLLQSHCSRDESTRFLQSLTRTNDPSLAEDFLTLREMYLDLVRVMPAAISRIGMVRAQKSQDLIDEIEKIIQRPLPHSAELLGVAEAEG